MGQPLEPDARAPEVWDRLLRKYVSVWLWSILFGATTGLGTGLAYLSFGGGARWGPLGPVILATALSGVAVVLSAWWSLYLYLVRVLLPQFFGEPPVSLLDCQKNYG